MMVNVVQSADAEDPWLQAEWGLTLLAESRAREAVTHLHVRACFPLALLIAWLCSLLCGYSACISIMMCQHLIRPCFQLMLDRPDHLVSLVIAALSRAQAVSKGMVINLWGSVS